MRKADDARSRNKDDWRPQSRQAMRLHPIAHSSSKRKREQGERHVGCTDHFDVGSIVIGVQMLDVDGFRMELCTLEKVCVGRLHLREKLVDAVEHCEPRHEA